MLHLNVRSIPANLPAFQSYLDILDHHFSIIGLTETWLKPSNISAYGIGGYNHVGITRQNTKGGGISLFISQEIVYSEMTDLCMVTDYLECLFVKVNTNGSSYVVGVVYRPPNSNITLFNEKINDILNEVSNMSCYVMGDYNIDLLKHENHLQTAEFLNNMQSNSLIPLIYKPTRETKTTATLIDNIFTNNYNVNNLLLQGLLITDISDHYAIFHIWDKPWLETDQYQLIRLVNETRLAKYKETISTTDWSILDQYKSCEVYFTHFFNKMKSIHDKSFPIIKVKKRYRNRIPWLTSGLRESIKQKNKLYRISLKHPTAYNEILYKQYRNMITKLLRLEEKQYYQSQIEANKDNIRKTWLVINIKQAINQKRSSSGSDTFYDNGSDNGITNDPAVIADAFNNYFVNIGPNLSSKIPEKGTQYRKYMPKGNEYSLFLLPATDKEVTHMALIILLENLTKALENGESAIGIFLDFQKAFDTVNHSILLDKLYIYGIRVPALSWITSYLSNRCQYVVYNGYESERKYINCGVPQGSILGPLLFLIYINDLPAVSKLFMPILFADDTNLFCTSQNVNSLIEEINRELANVYAWVQSNKLSLNIDKTNYMLFSPKCACKPSKIIVIDGQSIMEVNETKFLGVIIDNRLKWSSHLGHISNKISKGIGIITKVRKVFDASTLMSLYNSLILPYIMYCVHVSGSAYETHLRQLMTLQNKIVKLIAGVPRRTNADALYVKLNILPLKKLFVYNVGLFMYKYDNDMLPELFADMFTPVCNIHNYDTRKSSGYHLYVDFHGTTRSQKCIKYLGPHIWNFILTKMNPHCSIGLFKSTFRNLLMQCSVSDLTF